jgi:oligopeptide transport system substrate-binding protein
MPLSRSRNSASFGPCFFFAALLCVFFLSACAKKSPAPSADTTPQVLRLSQRNEPADLDPAYATLPDEFFIIRALGEGLVTAGPDGRMPQPASAARWEISADSLTYTFHLRPEARWSNGDPVTSSDYIASYRRLLAPATAAPKADLFDPVKNARAFTTGTITDFTAVGFAAPDPHTLVITLERPTPAFLLYVASGPWIPVHPATVSKHGRNWTKPAHHVGNGPFTLTEWRQQQRIVVEKNPTYRAAAAVRLNEIQFLRFDSGDTEERAYRAGQVDVTMSVPISKIETYTREHPAEIFQTPLAETRYLTFNTRRPPLDDPRVRRALSLAIDREKITALVLRGGQLPTTTFLPPSLVEPDLRAGSPNPTPQASTPSPLAHAREAAGLLTAAGFPGGKNFPRLELTGWSQTPVLEAIQAMWKTTLGLDVGIALREAKVHLSALRTGDYDIGFITEIPDLADAAPSLANFATGAPGNYPQWSDPRYDALLAHDRVSLAASSTPAPLARDRAGVAAAEALLLEAAPIAPLYFNTKNWLKSPRVQGWQEDPFWSRDYTGVILTTP